MYWYIIYFLPCQLPFAHRPTHLKITVAFQILGLFIYVLSIPVHSSLSTEHSSNYASSEGFHPLPVAAFLCLKVWGLVISGIFLFDTEMKKRLLLLSQIFPCKCSILHTYFSHALWIHGITITPTIYLNIWQISWQNLFLFLQPTEIFSQIFALWSDVPVNTTEQQFTLPGPITLSKQS